MFVESSEFTAHVLALLTDENYIKLQILLMERPDCGKVMPGCGGLRKLRLPDSRRGKGKRGGIRVIYLHVPEANLIFFVDIYHKNSQEDLTPSLRKRYKALALNFKREATQ